jgi:hypothetical protein
MCERWDFRRGFSIDRSRHKIDLKITRKVRGLFAKRPYLQPPAWDGQELLMNTNVLLMHRIGRATGDKGLG